MNRIAFVLVALVAFATTGCTTGRYLGPNPYPGQLGQAVAANLGMTCPGDVFIGPPVNRCLRHLTNIGPHFAGYPMFAGGSNGRQLSRSEKIVLIGGASAVGGGLLGGTKGAIIGGVTGGVITAMATRGGKKDKNQPIVVREGEQVRIGPDGIPVAIGTPVVQQSQQQGSLGISQAHSRPARRAMNRTALEVAVYYKGEDPRTAEPLEVIPRNGSWAVPLNSSGYDVFVLIPTGTLGVQDARPAAVVPNHDFTGWDIVVPAGR